MKPAVWGTSSGSSEVREPVTSPRPCVPLGPRPGLQVILALGDPWVCTCCRNWGPRLPLLRFLLIQLQLKVAREVIKQMHEGFLKEQEGRRAEPGPPLLPLKGCLARLSIRHGTTRPFFNLPMNTCVLWDSKHMNLCLAET